jgi:hypothetical protein
MDVERQVGFWSVADGLTTVSVMKGVGDQDRGGGGEFWVDIERRPKLYV